MKNFLALFLFCLLTQTLQAYVGDACQKSETWKNLSLGDFWNQRFINSVNGKLSPVESMALAFKLKNSAETKYEEVFSEYWITNSLLRSGHFILAGFGFEKILNQLPKDSEYQSLRIATFDCLAELHHQYPSRKLNRNIQSSLALLPPSETRDYMAFRWSLENRDYSNSLKLISADSPYLNLTKAMQLYEKQEWQKSSVNMDEFFSKSKKLKYVKSQINHWKLFAARVHFTATNHSKALEYWQSVDKRSNELVQSLTELSWNHLKAGHHNDALGSALSLQTGWLSNTYSPESLMVMAMAFNETCHYPEAMRAVELLRRQYDPVILWLNESKNIPSTKLYSELVLSLKKQSSVPFRLSGEWVRSANFLSAQNEINSILKIADVNVEFKKQAQLKQKERILSLLKFAKSLRKDLEAQQKLEPSRADFPMPLELRLEDLKSQIVEYEALREFAPVWIKIEKSNQSLAVVRKNELMKIIEKHIQYNNKRISDQLADIYDNIKFVEIEIYQGATQDMIVSHSQAEVQSKLSGLKNKKEFQLKSGELSWGQISTEKLGQSEIWEDELGGFKTDLPNKCLKEKFARSEI